MTRGVKSSVMTPATVHEPDYYLNQSAEILGVTTGYLRHLIGEGLIEHNVYDVPGGIAYAIPRSELARVLNSAEDKTVGRPISRKPKGLPPL